MGERLDSYAKLTIHWVYPRHHSCSIQHVEVVVSDRRASSQIAIEKDRCSGLEVGVVAGLASVRLVARRVHVCIGVDRGVVAVAAIFQRTTSPAFDYCLITTRPFQSLEIVLVGVHVAVTG